MWKSGERSKGGGRERGRGGRGKTLRVLGRNRGIGELGGRRLGDVLRLQWSFCWALAGGGFLVERETMLGVLRWRFLAMS